MQTASVEGARTAPVLSLEDLRRFSNATPSHLASRVRPHHRRAHELESLQLSSGVGPLNAASDHTLER